MQNGQSCRVFKRNSETIGSPNRRNLADFFRTIEVPIDGKQKVIKFPNWIRNILALIITVYQKLRPGKPVDIPILPPLVRLLTKCLSEYDPEFTRAFVDGSACQGFDHSKALEKVMCPVLILHANWFRNPETGLVGSIDDNDVKKLRDLVPHCQYERITSGHMIHFEKPREFNQAVETFVRQFATE